MGKTPKGSNPLKIIGLCLLAVLLIGVGWLGANVIDLAKEASVIASTTPSPAPDTPNVLQVTIDPALPTPEPLIKSGMKGDLVKTLQQRLLDLGFYFDEVDGQFGPGTKSAVIWFQTQHDLDADGIAGASTQEKLYSDTAEKAKETPAPTQAPVPSPAPTQNDEMPIIISKAYPVDESYAPKDLVTLNDYCDEAIVKIKNEETQGVKAAVDALITMLKAAHAQELTAWQVSAGYRTYAYQQGLLDEQIQDNMRSGKITEALAREAALENVALPGTSEHHTGLAFDLTVPDTEYFAGTPQAAWLKEHCFEYGFIIRYTKDKESITGFDAEPWHVRYVGIDHATAMQSKGLCLEEYALD